MSLSLRSRFWWVSLGLVLASSLLLVLVLTTILTPDAAQRLVQLEEKSRLLELSHQLVTSPPSEWQNLVDEKGGEYIKLESDTGKAGGISVAVPNSHYRLVSDRPVTFWESRKVIQPPPWRQFFALLTFCLALFLLAHLLSRFVVDPVSKLTEGVRAISQGERGVEVPVPQEMELAELARGFNQMSRDLAQREAELRTALEAKEKIFATTSHELRTPLTVVLGYCQMLEDGLKGDLNEEQLRIVAVMKRNARSLLGQVETLLTLSQLRSDSLPLNCESADLRDLAHEVTEELQPLAAQKDLELKVTVPSESVGVKLDYQRGCQIARNLIANAIKFTAAGGVEVLVEDSNGQARLVVRDSGPGISEEFQALLFQEFSRGEDTEGVEGSGLGLALSRRLAHGMGGDVDLVSSGEDGSEFTWWMALENA